MPTVLHIDGLSTEPQPFIAIAPGESLYDLVKRYGGTVRVEQVPDQPKVRELAPEAKAFLTDYEYEESGSVLAVYWRYHSLDAEEFDTVEEAERFLGGGEEYGELAGEAIVGSDGTITVCD